ncbi:ribonuclease E/G, partial [Streptomyces sp. NPDC057638]|uniref:Rne/Rng family ribonuclease n=1 Tax=Streptomyces sp. NPDC057638 TaxID=3346190 RepID=UPI00368225BB
VAVAAEVPAAVVEQSAEVVAEPVAEESAAPRRTRRRASAPAGSPVAEASAEVAEQPAAEAVTEPVAEESAAPRRTRRRATRQVTAAVSAAEDTGVTREPAKAKAPATAEKPAKAKAPAAAEKPAKARSTEETAPRGRGRRRVVVPEFTAEPVPAAERDAPRRAARPAVAVFQAPVFTEPMFQTPETAAAAAAAARHLEEVEETEEAEYAAELDQTATQAESAEPADAEPAEDEPAAEVAPEPTGRRRRRRRGEGREELPSAEVAAAAAAVEAVEPAAEARSADEEQVAEAEEAGEAEEEFEDRPSRRRRRGGRRRRRGEAADAADADEESAEAAAEDESADEELAEAADSADLDDDSPSGGSSSSRRRRRRRRRSGEPLADEEVSAGDPERTVVKVREPRARKSDEPSDEVQSIKGSTRLEAKKQRRREGREQGRRRVPIITEAEFLARREAVERVMVVRQSGERTQIGVLEDNVLVEHYVNKEQATSYVGNVYLGKVQNVLPSMEAAFVDIGKGRNAVLYAGEVNFEALGMANGPRRIEAALKSGQSVLVQVTKDPIGHKGARLTSQVSLPGRYLVYVPEGSMTGISRKLPDTERARLKTILKKIVPEDAGVIVRTAAEGASEDELRRDVERLQAQWEEIQKKAKSGGAPTLLYGEPDMTVRVVRDIFNEDFSKVIVSGDDAWETIHGYVSHVAPDLAERLQRWTSEVDVFATYRIDEQLMKALDRKVWLPSGGSLVIDKTEAMVVIDVNTGKFTGQGGNLEETVTRNNLEAAEEIVRQLRLRDLGGIVVVDFIDMVLESNRDLVMRRLLECLGRDRTKHQVAEVTSLGLVQMTRKRVGQGLLESFSETCVHCNGRGLIVHMDQPTSVGGGGGGKRSKKRGRGGADHAPEVHETHETHEAHEGRASVSEAPAEPVALPEPAFVPDEELYSSAAEAEAAAMRGRGRRRVTRRASAPSGAPKAAEAEAPAEPAAAAEKAEPAPAAEKKAGKGRASRRASRAEVAPEPEQVPEVAPEPQAPVQEQAPAPAPVQEQAPQEAEAPAEAAPAGRTRRRATRKATAPAGSPKAADTTVPEVVIATSEPEAPVAEAPQAPAAPVVAEAPAEAAPPKARRRVTRKATAPAGSPSGAEEAAVVVVTTTPSAAEAPAEVEAAPAKKTARKTAAKKAPAKKAPAKKAPAKKAATTKTAATKA